MRKLAAVVWLRLVDENKVNMRSVKEGETFVSYRLHLNLRLNSVNGDNGINLTKFVPKELSWHAL